MESETPTRKRKSPAVISARILHGGAPAGTGMMPRNQRSNAIWNTTIMMTAIPRAMSISGNRSGTCVVVIESESFFNLFVVVYDKNWFFQILISHPELPGIRGNEIISDDFIGSIPVFQ
jgi:hypothetical protein